MKLLTNARYEHMPAGRKPIEIDFELLQKIISEVEGGEDAPKTRSQLWKKVADLWPIKISPQTLMTKAEKNSLTILTPKGVRGSILVEARAKPKKKRERKFPPAFEGEVRERFGRLGSNTTDKMLSGNMKAAVKAFCWDCMGESKKEVSLCGSYTCPLWPHRPWQRSAENNDKLFPLPMTKNDDTELSERLEAGESEPSSGVTDKPN